MGGVDGTLLRGGGVEVSITVVGPRIDVGRWWSGLRVAGLGAEPGGWCVVAEGLPRSGAGTTARRHPRATQEQDHYKSSLHGIREPQNTAGEPKGLLLHDRACPMKCAFGVHRLEGLPGWHAIGEGDGEGGLPPHRPSPGRAVFRGALFGGLIPTIVSDMTKPPLPGQPLRPATRPKTPC